MFNELINNKEIFYAFICGLTFGAGITILIINSIYSTFLRRIKKNIKNLEDRLNQEQFNNRIAMRDRD